MPALFLLTEEINQELVICSWERGSSKTQGVEKGIPLVYDNLGKGKEQ